MWRVLVGLTGRCGVGLSVPRCATSRDVQDVAAIVVSQIIPDGVAARHGGLRVGDQILSVNGVSLTDVTHSRAVEVRVLECQLIVWCLGIYSCLVSDKLYSFVRCAVCASHMCTPPHRRYSVCVP